MDKTNLLNKYIDKGILPGRYFDKLMDITSHFNTDMDKVNMLNKLISKGEIKEERSFVYTGCAPAGGVPFGPYHRRKVNPVGGTEQPLERITQGP